MIRRGGIVQRFKIIVVEIVKYAINLFYYVTNFIMWQTAKFQKVKKI